MLFQVVAEMAGEAYAQRTLQVTYLGIEVELQVDPQSHRATHIALTVPVANAVDVLRRSPPPSGPVRTLPMPPTPRFEEMRALLQYLESVGSFWLSCERVNWAEPLLRWIAESEEEEQLLEVSSFSFKREYDPRPMSATEDVLRYLLESQSALSRYVVPLAFYREGLREHTAKRYLYAFSNFYFVLEDLYARGQFKARAVEEAFLGSPALRSAVDFTLQRLGEHDEAGHKGALAELGRTLGCDMSTAGVLRLVVQMRGNLHHFSSSSPNPKGHPLNQADYEALSFLMFGICVAVVADLMPGGGPGRDRREG